MRVVCNTRSSAVAVAEIPRDAPYYSEMLRITSYKKLLANVHTYVSTLLVNYYTLYMFPILILNYVE